MGRSPTAAKAPASTTAPCKGLARAWLQVRLGETGRAQEVLSVLLSSLLKSNLDQLFDKFTDAELKVFLHAYLWCLEVLPPAKGWWPPEPTTLYDALARQRKPSRDRLRSFFRVCVVSDEVILNLLHSGSSAEKVGALEGLARRWKPIGTDVMGRIRNMASGVDERVRTAAAKELLRRDEPQGVSVVMRLLTSLSPVAEDLRQACLVALRRIRGPRTAAKLFSLLGLNTTSPATKSAVLDGLWHGTVTWLRKQPEMIDRAIALFQHLSTEEAEKLHHILLNWMPEAGPRVEAALAHRSSKVQGWARRILQESGAKMPQAGGV